MDWFNCIKILMPYRELGCWGLSISYDTRFYNHFTQCEQETLL